MSTVEERRRAWQAVRYFKRAEDDGYDYKEYGIKAVWEGSSSHSLNFEIIRVWNGGVKPEDSEVFLKGHVKWDGCMNVEQGDTTCMWHFCDATDLPRVFDLIGRMIYKYAIECLEPQDNLKMNGALVEIE